MAQSSPARPTADEQEPPASTFDWFHRTMTMRPKSYGYLRQQSTIWTQPRKPLRECRVALLSSAGIHRSDDTPFDIRKGEEGGPVVPVYLRYPLGNIFGEVGNAPQQRTILRDALQVIDTATEPGFIVDLPYLWRRSTFEDF